MLTREQLKQLEQFCRSSGASYYEVQVELVDHMAEIVEHQIAEGADFERAFTQMKKQFPSVSMRKIVGAKEKFLLKSYLRLFAGCWWSFFTWPKLLILVSLYALIWLISPYMSSKDMVFIGHNLVALYGGIHIWVNKNLVRKNLDEAKHKLLSIRITYYIGAIIAALMLLQFYLLWWNETTAIIIAPLLNYFYPLFLLLVVSFYHTQVIFHQNLRQQFRNAFN